MLETLFQEDLQHQNYWYCVFGDFIRSLTLVKSVSFPLEKLTTETKKYGEKYYVGFTPAETVKITFYENTNFSVYKYFKTWMDTVFDSKTKTFNVLDIGDVLTKYRTATIYMYSSIAGVPTPNRQFKFENLMIIGLDELTFDTENGNPMEWSVEFAVGDTSCDSFFG